MTKAEVIEFIRNSVDSEELSEIYNAAHQRFKLVSRHILFNVGDKVQMKPEYHHRRPFGEIGNVEKVNSAKIKVNFGLQGVWSVPKSLVVKV